MPGVVKETVQFSHWLLSVVILLSCKWEEAGHSSLYKCVCCFSYEARLVGVVYFWLWMSCFLTSGAVSISSSFLHDHKMAANILCVVFTLWSTLEEHWRGKNRQVLYTCFAYCIWKSIHFPKQTQMLSRGMCAAIMIIHLPSVCYLFFDFVQSKMIGSSEVLTFSII